MLDFAWDTTLVLYDRWHLLHKLNLYQIHFHSGEERRPGNFELIYTILTFSLPVRPLPMSTVRGFAFGHNWVAEISDIQ